MFYATQEFGVATGNISACSGAPVEKGTVQAEAPHC